MSEQSDVASVQVIDRAFSVLELVSNEGSMSLKDIYTLLGLNKASAMRIANALVANGYFDKDERGNYSLTFKAYEVGIRAVRRVDYITFIRETLDQLAAELGVIAQFSVKEGTELLCLESFDLTRSNFSVYTKVGIRSQLYATSAGKAILMTYKDEEIKNLWDQMNIRIFTPKTITDYDQFMQRIYEARHRGYALDDEESELGLFCIGAPLVNSTRKAIGAISLSTNRMDDETERRLSTGLLAATQRLGYMLNYSMK